MRHIVDISNRTDVAANAALVTWGETVRTAQGEIEPTPAGFVLTLHSAKKPRKFPTASGAIEVLRRAK